MTSAIQVFGGIATPIAMVPQLVTVDAPNVPPSPVSDLTALDVTGTTATLQWGLSTDSDGTVVGYRVYEVVSGTDTLRYSPTTSPQNITGLTEGTSYTWRVRAIDDDGELSTTATVGFTTQSTDITAPTVPGSLASSNITTTGFTLTWTASTDAESGVSHYEVFDTSLQISANVAFGTNTFTPANPLTQGTTYHMRVKAVDAAGNKSAAATLDVTTTSTADPPPPPPTNLSVDDTTTVTANLSWTAPSVTTDVQGYNLYFWNGTTETATTPGATSATNITLTGLTQNTTYTVRLKSRDSSFQFSTFLQTTFTTSTAAVTVNPPTGLAVDSKTQNTATLAWTASTTAGVTGYNSYFWNGTTETATTPAASPSSPITLQNLTASTTYTVRIKARDASFNFSNPASITFTTNAVDTTPPAAPTNLTFSNVTTNGVDVNWTASTAPDLAGHRVLRLINSVWTALGNDKPVGTNTHATLNLDPATTYSFRVRAVDTAGNLSTPANSCQGDVTTATTGTVASPFDREFGLVTANVGTVEQLTEIVTAVNGDGAGGWKANPKLTIFRKAVEMETSYNNGWSTGNCTQMADVVAPSGGKLLFCPDYTALPFARKINLGMATATAGNQYLVLDNPYNHGGTAATGQAPTATVAKGKWGTLAIGLRDPATGQWMTNIIPMTGTNIAIANDGSDGGIGNFQNGNRWCNLKRGSHADSTSLSGQRDNPYTLTASGRGELIVGVRRSQESDKMTCICSASNDNATTPAELEPYGIFCYETCRKIGAGRIWAVEMSNETNHFLGVLPYADPALQYRNFCHGYVGIKKALPNAFVVPSGPGDNDGQYPHMPDPLRWYQLLKREATVNQPNYFNNLKASMGVSSPGPMPWDWVSIHAYCSNPNQVDSNPYNAMNSMALIYNEFGGAYPLIPTEQGPSWNAVGYVKQNPSEPGNGPLGTGHPLNAAGAGDWWAAMNDYTHGNKRWNHNVQFVGTNGTILSATGSTLAQRRAAARHIFRPYMHFAMMTPSGGEQGNTKGMYSGNAQADPNRIGTRKFTLAPGNGDILDQMRDYS